MTRPLPPMSRNFPQPDSLPSTQPLPPTNDLPPNAISWAYDHERSARRCLEFTYERFHTPVFESSSICVFPRFNPPQPLVQTSPSVTFLTFLAFLTFPPHFPPSLSHHVQLYRSAPFCPRARL